MLRFIVPLTIRSQPGKRNRNIEACTILSVVNHLPTLIQPDGKENPVKKLTLLLPHTVLMHGKECNATYSNSGVILKGFDSTRGVIVVIHVREPSFPFVAAINNRRQTLGG